jgi:hypothetical protein
VTVHHALDRAFKDRDAMRQGWIEMLERLATDLADEGAGIAPAIP